MITVKRKMAVKHLKCSKHLYALVLLLTLISAFFISPSHACAGGVHFGVGVDFPPGYVPPPVAVYPPPVVVERVPPPPVVVERTAPPVVVERVAPPVVIRRTAPTVVYEAPVVVERRTVTTYYPPQTSYQYRSYREETEGEYYREKNHRWEESY